MRRNSGRTVPILLLVAVYACLGAGPAGADDNAWLVGHWDGRDNKNLQDQRKFELDIARVASDQSFVAQWSNDGHPSRAQGKVDGNAVAISFPNGNTANLFRTTDGNLAGTTARQDGTPGATLLFTKSGAAASIGVQGKGCEYRMPQQRRAGGGTQEASNGDVVVTSQGMRKCVNGKLVPD